MKTIELRQVPPTDTMREYILRDVPEDKQELVWAEMVKRDTKHYGQLLLNIVVSPRFGNATMDDDEQALSCDVADKLRLANGHVELSEAEFRLVADKVAKCQFVIADPRHLEFKQYIASLGAPVV
jgi:BarA-like signal transduction histidine kinase